MAESTIYKVPECLPCYHAGDFEYEQGFKVENLIKGTPIPELLCGICHGIPRQYCAPPHCYHLFCKSCLTYYIAQYGYYQQTRRYEPCRMFRCPICQKESPESVTMWDDSPHYITQIHNVINGLQLKCPYGCPFVGSSFDMDRHQLELCEERPIQCPNYACFVVVKAKEMGLHFQKCNKHRTYCPECFLPVLISELAQHDCHDARREALKEFYKHYRIFGLRIPGLLREGHPNQAMYSEKIHVNRFKFVKLIDPRKAPGLMYAADRDDESCEYRRAECELRKHDEVD